MEVRPTAHQVSGNGTVDLPLNTYDGDLGSRAIMRSNAQFDSVQIDYSGFDAGTPNDRTGMVLNVHGAWQQNGSGDYVLLFVSGDGGSTFPVFVQHINPGAFGAEDNPVTVQLDCSPVLTAPSAQLVVRVFFFRSGGVAPGDPGFQNYEVWLDVDGIDPPTGQYSVGLGAELEPVNLQTYAIPVDVPPPQALPPGNEIAGIEPLNHYAPQWPWMQFHDWSGDIQTVGYTDPELDQIAALGLGLWELSRIYTPEGQAVLGQILARNPDFLIDTIWSCLTYRPTSVGSARPMANDWMQNLVGRECQHLDGALCVAWPAPPAATQAWWHQWRNAGQGTGGEIYDQVLLKALWDSMAAVRQQNQSRPFTMQHDYFPRISQGPSLYSSEVTAHGECDEDQNGVVFASDQAEADSFRAFVEAYSDECERVNPGIYQKPNGKGPTPEFGEAGVAQRSHGMCWEFFPRAINVQGSRAYDTLVNLEATYNNWFTPINGIIWNQLQLAQNQNVDTESPTSQVQACRIASMIFSVPWCRLFDRASGHLFVDPRQSSFAGAGQPVAKPIREDIGPRHARWARQFQGGVAVLEVNDNTWAAQWQPGGSAADLPSILKLELPEPTLERLGVIE